MQLLSILALYSVGVSYSSTLRGDTNKVIVLNNMIAKILCKWVYRDRDVGPSWRSGTALGINAVEDQIREK